MNPLTLLEKIGKGVWWAVWDVIKSRKVRLGIVTLVGCAVADRFGVSHETCEKILLGGAGLIGALTVSDIAATLAKARREP